MNKKISVKIFTLICLLFLPLTNIRAEGASVSKAECVTEISSRRFLHEKNADVSLPMASTTKILTAIIIIEDCNLDEMITVPREGAGIEGSSVYLKAGDKLTVRDLLYGLMLRSGNDCAVTLALHHSGSIARFASVMNRRAEAMGATDSRFENPHGLPSENHYTTARDLSLISAYAMQNCVFSEIVSCHYYQEKGWQNKNKMLYTFDGAIGVKTGFTVLAGRCLVTAAQKNGMTVVCVVLNSPEMYERTKELLQRVFDRYELKRICKAGDRIENMQMNEDFCYPLSKDEAVDVRIVRLTAPSANLGGRMEIYLENNLIFSQNLYIIE
ncbi:MAG: D-alanyl-D-alanine carboxypeptidase [Clostridia bacterium]|nr:D-alanyl-D-alanine carboxypeptidase [Clostridia bacterium]